MGQRARVAREAAYSDLALQYGSPRQYSPTRSSELARAQELGGTISAEVNLLHNAKYTNDGGQETEPKESNVLQDEYVERHGAADNLNSDDGLENEDDIDNVYIDDTDDLDYTEGKKDPPSPEIPLNRQLPQHLNDRAGTRFPLGSTTRAHNP